MKDEKLTEHARVTVARLSELREILEPRLAALDDAIDAVIASEPERSMPEERSGWRICYDALNQYRDSIQEQVADLDRAIDAVKQIGD